MYIEEDKSDNPKKDCRTFNNNPKLDVPKPIGSVKTIKFFNHCQILIEIKYLLIL